MEQRKNVNILIATLNEEIKFMYAVEHLLDRSGPQTAQTVAERREFIKPCPAGGCRGFLSTGWKCGLCATKVCPRCHEIKADADGGGEHECKPENVATVETLTKSSRPCPKCGASIQKIEGCSQMFHTPLAGGCGAVFDWGTLRLYTGGVSGVHNPHWYEYMRQRNGVVPRNDADVPCGGMPSIYHLNNLMLTIYADRDRDSRKRVISTIDQIHQGYTHNQYVALHKYAVDAIADNRPLRVAYLLHQIDEQRFKHQIQMFDKARNKKIHLGQILRMYNGVIVDIFIRLNGSKSVTDVESTLAEVGPLVVYTNRCFNKASSIYDSVATFIDPSTFRLATGMSPVSYDNNPLIGLSCSQAMDQAKV